jgi:hypothetical protein
MKDKNIEVIGYLVKWVDMYRRMFAKEFDNKRQLQLMANQMISDQLVLISGCIKSESYKDFYDARSYLSL